MDAREAFLDLNAWAADFKAGVLPDQMVMDTLSVIIAALDIENKEQVMKQALAQWWIDPE